MGRLFTVLVLLALVPSASSFAAADAPPAATLSGTVSAPDGSMLPGTTITIVNRQSGDRVTVVTGGDGAYRASLSSGMWHVRVEIEGFQAMEATVEVTAGADASRSFTLPLATLQEQLEVVGMIPRGTVSAGEFAESTARDVGEAVARMAGMSMVRKGGIANDIVMRGYQGENITVLIDGARLHGACPNNMDPIAFHADIAEVERVEVGRGPFDVRSQGSLGGVVNVITARPQQGWHGAANFSFGSAAFVNPSGTASYGAGRVSLLGGYSFRRGAPYEDGDGRPFTSYGNYRPDAVDSAAFNVGTGWIRAYASPRDGRSLHAAYTHQQADHVLYPYLQMDGVSDTADRLTGAYEFAGTSVQAYYSRVAHTMTDEYRRSATGARGYSMGSDAATRTFGGKVQTTAGAARAGIELFRREWSVTTSFAMGGYQPLAALPDVAVTNAGAYAESALAAGRVKVEYGGRVDWSRSRAAAGASNYALYTAYFEEVATSRTDVYPSAKARVVIAAGDRLSLEGGVGHAVRVPDPQERYYAISRMGTDFVGNPSLAPSRNTEVEGGVQYRAGRLHVDATAYADFVADFVIVARASRLMAGGAMANTAARTFANVDARLRGFEAKVDYSLGPALFSSAGISYTRGVKTPDPPRGIRAPDVSEIPPLSGRASLRYDRAVWFAEISGSFAAAQEHVDVDVRELPTPGHVVAVARVGTRTKHLRITATVDNLFDKLYAEHLSYQRDPFRSGVVVPSPGRTMSVKTTVAF